MSSLTSNFTAAMAKELFQAVQSYAQQLALFQATETNDPVNAPGNRLWCSISLGPVRPIQSSGLASVSGQVTLIIRIWSSAMQRPYDNIDPEVLGAACSMIGALAGGFTLGGTVRDVVLFSLNAVPRYVEFDGSKEFRVMEITCPIEINDMWAEAA